jgi:hypothetical protein
MSGIYYPPEQQPIDPELDGDNLPVAFRWRGRRFQITRIDNSYDAPEGTLLEPILRTYFVVLLKHGMGLIYHDRIEQRWGIEFSYD